MQLVFKISNLCDPDPSTSQTDGQIDRQMDDMRYALVHRTVKIVKVQLKVIVFVVVGVFVFVLVLIVC